MRRVISIFLPHWPIERLKRERTTQTSCPSGKAPDDVPYALVEAGAKGVRLTAVNDHARRLGLHIGMTLADARTVHPNLHTDDAEPEKDAGRLFTLAHWCGRYSPWVNVDKTHVAGTKGLWIDATGCAHLFGGESAMLADIQSRLAGFGFSAGLGLADTPGAAWGLARYAMADKRIAPPGRTRQAIRHLPLAALRLESDILVLLRRLGLVHVGQLYNLPRAALTRRFKSQDLSAAVLTRLDQALGNRYEPLSPLKPPPVYRSRLVFAEPLQLLDSVEQALTTLLETLCQSLKKDQKGARALTLWAYRVDGRMSSAHIAASRASQSADHFRHLFRERLAAIDAGFGIETLILSADSVEDLKPDQVSLQKAVDEPMSERALGELVDRLDHRDGIDDVHRSAPVASHIPERAARKVPATQSGDWSALPQKPQRPMRLLPVPEHIQVMAEIPEGPPMTFTWRRVARRIAHAEGPERIAPEWWQDDARQRGHVRDYYRVEDVDGRRYWLFRDGLYRDGAQDDQPQWFIHGLFA